MKRFRLKIQEMDQVIDYIMKNWKVNKPLLLQGEIGAGKTTLAKELAKRLGINERVASPTFTIMKIYNKLVHIDAYRIDGDLSEYEDYFLNKYLIIEWPKKHNFQSFIKVEIDFDNDFNYRKYIVTIA